MQADAFGERPIDVAIQCGHVDVVRALLLRGCDVNESLHGGMSLVAMAVLNGHLDISKLLIRDGADPFVYVIQYVTTLSSLTTMKIVAYIVIWIFSLKLACMQKARKTKFVILMKSVIVIDKNKPINLFSDISCPILSDIVFARFIQG